MKRTLGCLLENVIEIGQSAINSDQKPRNYIKKIPFKHRVQVLENL